MALAMATLMPATTVMALKPEEISSDPVLMAITERSESESQMLSAGEAYMRWCVDQHWAPRGCWDLLEHTIEILIRERPCDWVSWTWLLTDAARNRSASPIGWTRPILEQWRRMLLTALPYIPPSRWGGILSPLPEYVWRPTPDRLPQTQTSNLAMVLQLRRLLLAAPDMYTAPEAPLSCHKSQPMVVVTTDEGGRFRFEPDRIEVRVGQQVTLRIVNFGPSPHDLTIPDAQVHTGQLDVWDERTLTFIAPTRPGEYPFFCVMPGHQVLGMSGTLVVR